MPNLKKEQIEVINHEKGNILVSASAGSGKTFVMIERLIRLITEGKTSVKNILCVTFTEAAASEMKEKLKTALSKKIAEGAPFAEELLEVETADICTIHSFCSRLIRKYFFTANVSPNFKVLDEGRAELIAQESLDETFKKYYRQKDKTFYTLLARHQRYRSDKAFKNIIFDIYKFLQVDANPNNYIKEILSLFTNVERAEKLYKEYINVDAKALLSYVYELMSQSKALEFVNAQTILEQLACDLTEIINGNLYQVKRFANYKLSLTFGRKLSEEMENIKNHVKKLYAKVLALIKRVNDHVSDEAEEKEKGIRIKEHLEGLFEIVNTFSQIYAKNKKEENGLDFSDLEHYALKILGDEETLKTIKANYKYVFADEYQDVNGVQEEILSLISENNLFMVGDVKQSIYGFRGCRPEIFKNKEKMMKANGEKTVNLNHNFRSAQMILEKVNEIFSYSMTPTIYGMDYENTSSLRAGGIYPESDSGRVALYFLSKEDNKKEEESARIYDILAEEQKIKLEYPSNVALLIEKIIKEELGKSYYNIKTGKHEQITYSDIVILNKNRDNDYVFSLVSDLLKLNIPVSSEVSENVCVFWEIQLLINVLKLIDCKVEDIPLVSVMKSPVGNFSENELVKISLMYKEYLSALDKTKKKERSFYLAYLYALENAEDDLRQKLIDFNCYIDQIRFEADFVGAGRILEKVIYDCGLENYIIAKGKGERRLDRINFFLNIATAEKSYTVHEFLVLIDKSPKTFLMSPSVTDDAIRVMTIHASKGLEFPVVIVCGLEKGSNRRAQTEEILKDYQLGLCLKNYNDNERTVEENLFRGLFKEKMRLDKIKEDLRVFYVATTRAAYSMHLTIEAKDEIRKNVFTGADKFGDYLPLSMQAINVEPNDLKVRVDERLGKRKVLVGVPQQNLIEEISNNINFSYPYASCTTLPLKCSVTSVVEKNNKEEQPIFTIFSDEQTGVERGIIAHKVLENFEFNDCNHTVSLKNQVDNMIGKGIITLEEAKQIDLDKMEKSLKAFAPRLVGKELFREQPFMAEIDGKSIFSVKSDKVLVQGVIDLLAINGKEAEIIDYKYSVLSGQALKNKYSIQIDLYAQAVESVLKLKVVRKTLVNLLSGECVDF